MTELSSTDIRTIAARIELRLASIAENEGAIRAELDALTSAEPAASDDRLLDINSAATWLGVSRATMFRLLRTDQRLRHLKVGKRTLFRPEDLRTFAAQQVVP